MILVRVFGYRQAINNRSCRTSASEWRSSFVELYVKPLHRPHSTLLINDWTTADYVIKNASNKRQGEKFLWRHKVVNSISTANIGVIMSTNSEIGRESLRASRVQKSASFWMSNLLRIRRQTMTVPWLSKTHRGIWPCPARVQNSCGKRNVIIIRFMFQPMGAEHITLHSYVFASNQGK